MLGLGLNISKGVVSFLPTWLGAFISRVTTDSGSTENSQCAKGSIRELQSLERPRILFDTFDLDVAFDGGTVEAESCMVSKINSLFVPKGVFSIILPFEEAVLFDGGTVESASCLVSSLEQLDTIL